MKKSMVIDTKLGVFEYLNVVKAIADEYYDEDGEYQPHIGLINAMAVFYNVCVKEDRFSENHTRPVNDPAELDDIICDTEFRHEFNNAIYIDATQLDFANAYRDALDIVETKKS